MKHIKIYENFEEKYKPGDYVYFEGNGDWLDIGDFSEDTWYICYGKLIRKSNQFKNDNNYFDCEYITKVEGGEDYFDNIIIYKSEIERLMTSEEIEMYELRKNALKYNI